jgi:predicted MFS family arabinose efflux permease
VSAVLDHAPAPAREERAPGILAGLRSAGPSVHCLLVCAFVNQAGAFVQTFLVLFLVDHGVGEGRAGLALAAYGLGAVFGALLGGDLADRLGQRATIVLSMTCSAVLTASLGFLGSSADYPALIAVVMANGAIAQTYRPAAMAMLAGLVEGDRVVMTFSIYRIALNLGAVVGPLLAALVLTLSWNLLFWVDGATTLACGVLAMRFLSPPAVSAEQANAPEEAPSPGSPYITLLRDGRFLLYLVAMFASALIYMQYFSVLPLTLRAEAYSGAVYSAVLAVSAGLVITSELFVTSRVQKWRTPYAAGGGIVLLALGLAAYAPRAGLALLFAATAVGVLGQMMSGPTMFAHPPRVAPTGAGGRYTGAAHAMFGLGCAAGPFLGVLLWNHIGARVWILCGAVGLLAALAAVIAMPSGPREAGVARASTPRPWAARGAAGPNRSAP